MRSFLLLALALPFAACTSSRETAPPEPPPMERPTLTGEVTYRERMALPPGAVVHVQLQDVSLADAPAVTLARHTIRPSGRQVPIPFALDYDPGRVQARHTYAVRAEIRDADGALMWTTDTTYPVLTRGAPDDGVELVLVRVAERAPSTLTGGSWRLVGTVSPDGTREEPEPADGYSLSFSRDGRVSGRADCNSFTGQYETEGDRLTLDGVATALAACLPPSSAQAVMGALTEARAFRLDGDRLRIESRDGHTLLYERGAEVGMNPQPAPQSLTITCSDPTDGSFSVRARTGPGEIAVWLPERFGDRYLVLGQVRAASGAKYQDGDVLLWTRGSEALLGVDGESFSGCAVAPG